LYNTVVSWFTFHDAIAPQCALTQTLERRKSEEDWTPQNLFFKQVIRNVWLSKKTKLAWEEIFRKFLFGTSKPLLFTPFTLPLSTFPQSQYINAKFHIECGKVWARTRAL
jgi:hypothetical protein